MIAKREIEDIVAAHPELTDAAKTRFRSMGTEFADRQGALLLEAEAQAFAAVLSLEDLRDLANAAQSDAARHMRQKFPQFMGRTMTKLASINFAGDLRKSFCAETGKLCASNR